MIYQPTLQSVKTHPLPAWYDDAKFGIFIHWGVYSVPAFAPSDDMLVEEFLRGESDFARSPYAEWYQNSLRIKGSPTYRHHIQTYGAGFRYEQFAKQFNAELRQWDPDAWTGLFAHFYNRQPEGLVNDRWMQLPEFYFSAAGQASLEALIQRMKRGEMPDIPHRDFVTPEYATLDHITLDVRSNFR